MSEIKKPPAPTDRCLCIVNRDAGALAAVISSYLFEKDCYLPLFMFPPMTSPMTGGDNLKSDIYLSNLLGNETSVLINNAWARMGGSEYLILAGLSRNQMSYLSIPKGTKIIEIAALDDIAKQLSTLVAPEAGKVHCSEVTEILYHRQ